MMRDPIWVVLGVVASVGENEFAGASDSLFVYATACPAGRW